MRKPMTSVPVKAVKSSFTLEKCFMGSGCRPYSPYKLIENLAISVVKLPSKITVTFKTPEGEEWTIELVRKGLGTFKWRNWGGKDFPLEYTSGMLDPASVLAFVSGEYTLPPLAKINTYLQYQSKINQ
jgi:hypothetical protein